MISPIALKNSFLFLSLVLVGCFYFGRTYDDIVQRPSHEWSSLDCEIIIKSASKDNLRDQNCPNIKVMATPYYPSVVTAIGRISQRKKSWVETEYQKQMDTIFKDLSGLYMEWETNRLVDPRGNYFRNFQQMDSLLFLLIFHNMSWPCNIPFLINPGGFGTTVPLAKSSDWPCYVPDISNLEQRIMLVNDKNKFIMPKYVWGRKRNQLTLEETLLVMFRLRNDTFHFLEGTNNMQLVIKGFETDITFDFPLEMMK